MRLLLSLLFALFLITVVNAQEEDPYQIALQRIQEAEASGAAELDLSGLGLTELPPEIGNLSNLEILYLSDNQLSSLPPKIGNLSNLQELFLFNNLLNNIPPEIFNLSNLQWLALDNNQLSSLPAEIGNLNNLWWLALSGNQLSSVPPEIGSLSNLQILYLNDNQISSLPVEFGNLRNLCHLVIWHNRFQDIPIELYPLKRLGTLENCDYGTGLVLDDYLFDTLPEEVANGGTSAVLAYLENQAWWHFQRMVSSIAAMIALPCVFILAWRWKARRGKSKRKNDETSEKSKVQS